LWWKSPRRGSIDTTTIDTTDDPAQTITSARQTRRGLHEDEEYHHHLHLTIDKYADTAMRLPKEGHQIEDLP